MTADYVIDMGPAAGVHGGEIIAQGTAQDIMANPDSITGQYLVGTREIAVPEERRPISKKKVLRVVGATGNNLKSVTAEIPVGTFTCVLLHDDEVGVEVPVESHDRRVAAAASPAGITRF